MPPLGDTRPGAIPPPPWRINTKYLSAKEVAIIAPGPPTNTCLTPGVKQVYVGGRLNLLF